MRTRRIRAFLVASVGLVAIALPRMWSQQRPDFDRGRFATMLDVIASDVHKHYYDPKFHGVDWDAKVREAKDKIEHAVSLNMALAHIAAALDTLNDSHTFFIPPIRPYRHDFGWRIQMIGDRCYVTQVRPQSDAEAKGVKPGDEVLALNGYNFDRTSLWKLEYVFNILRPQPSLKVDLRDLAGNQRQVEIMAKMTRLKPIADLTGNDMWELMRQGENQEDLTRVRYYAGGDLLIVKIPEFVFSESEADKIVSQAGKHKSLILDLRSDPGGSVESLQWLLGGMFDKEVKIADRIGREKSKPLVAKKRHDRFTGSLVVLVDSKSGSAAEMFSRVIQLEKRGTVFGDRTSGSVMEAKHYSYRSGLEVVAFYGASITDADIIMTDGKSLEHVGVIPDVQAFPAAADLANNRDPVMARAAELLGAKLSPEEAGKLFPYKWPRN